MATKTRNVRYPEWIQQAILGFVEKNHYKDFSSAVIFLLECELNRRGYFRTDYEPGIMDVELSDDIKSPHERPSEREKKLEFENKSKELEIQRLNNMIEKAGISEETPSVIAGTGRYYKGKA
jgi:hypothetical protein